MLKAFFSTGSFNQNITMVIIATAIATTIVLAVVNAVLS